MRIGPYDFAPRAGITLLALGGFAVLLGCGLWQLERAQEKAAQIARFARGRAEAPVALGPSLPARPVAPGTRVQARGHYDERQFLLDNRTHAGRAGFHVLTPLHLDTGRAVLVNRGWLPAAGRRDELPRVGLGADGTAARTVLGTAAAVREDQLVLGETGYTGPGGWPRVVQRVELAPMSALLGRELVPLLVRLDPGAPDGYLRAWAPHLGLTPARHRAYAFQWFALAGALAVIYLVTNCRRPAAGQRRGDRV